MTGLLRPGDWLALFGAAALIITLLLGRPEGGDGVLIKREGRPFLEASLRLDRTVSVPGPLGETRVEIRNGQVRVQADPSPRQLCVRQGWLQAGETAVCLPNRVSVERGVSRYDSLNY
jgi:hypothetical protein